ncbi:hypothetical protein Dimus_030434, partial [Dionaea muscipula]
MVKVSNQGGWLVGRQSSRGRFSDRDPVIFNGNRRSDLKSNLLGFWAFSIVGRHEGCVVLHWWPTELGLRGIAPVQLWLVQSLLDVLRLWDGQWMRFLSFYRLNKIDFEEVKLISPNTNIYLLNSKAVKKGDTIFMSKYLFTGSETTSVWLE